MLFAQELNNVGFSVTRKYLFDDPVKPSDGYFPRFVIDIPRRREPAFTAKPLEICLVVRKSNQNWIGANAPVDNGRLCLPPNLC